MQNVGRHLLVQLAFDIAGLPGSFTLQLAATRYKHAACASLNPIITEIARISLVFADFFALPRLRVASAESRRGRVPQGALIHLTRLRLLPLLFHADKDLFVSDQCILLQIFLT